MRTSSSNHIPAKASVLALGILSITASFWLGIQTSGNVSPIDSTSATESGLGDINEDGVINLEDVIRILEISQGYNDPTTSELRADPNADGRLGVDDAIRLLHDLSR